VTTLAYLLHLLVLDPCASLTDLMRSAFLPFFCPVDHSSVSNTVWLPTYLAQVHIMTIARLELQEQKLLAEGEGRQPFLSHLSLGKILTTCVFQLQQSPK